MSRPQRAGLDYFPLDVHMDDKIELLEVDHGLEGFAILIKIFQKIYEEGYYINADLRRQKLLSRRINVDINLVQAVIMSAITYEIFDKNLYEKYKILTSTGIQKRYFKAIERRSSVEVIKEFLLININVYKNLAQVGLMYTETPVERELMYTESTQSKVKESKVKNINNSATFSENSPETENQPEPEKTPAAEPPALAEKNVFKDAKEKSRDSELYTTIKTLFENEQLQNRFTNYAKEGKAIKSLIKKAKARSPDSPDVFILGMIHEFRELHESGDKFWERQPFLPSALNSAGIFDRVLNEAQQRWKDKQPASDFDLKELVF